MPVWLIQVNLLAAGLHRIIAWLESDKVQTKKKEKKKVLPKQSFVFFLILKTHTHKHKYKFLS